MQPTKSQFFFVEPPKTALNKREFNKIIAHRRAFNILSTAGLQPQWKPTSELLTVQEADPVKVYVLYEFLGELFQHLSHLDCRIIGPLVVLQAHKYKHKFPMRKVATLSQSLYGKTVSAVGFGVDDEDEIRSKIMQLGGVYKKTVDKNTSIVICDVFVARDPQMQEAVSLRLLILRKRWMDKVFDATLAYDHSCSKFFDADFLSRYRIRTSGSLDEPPDRSNRNPIVENTTVPIVTNVTVIEPDFSALMRAANAGNVQQRRPTTPLSSFSRTPPPNSTPSRTVRLPAYVSTSRKRPRTPSTEPHRSSRLQIASNNQSTPRSRIPHVSPVVRLTPTTPQISLSRVSPMIRIAQNQQSTPKSRTSRGSAGDRKTPASKRGRYEVPSMGFYRNSPQFSNFRDGNLSSVSGLESGELRAASNNSSSFVSDTPPQLVSRDRQRSSEDHATIEETLEPIYLTQGPAMSCADDPSIRVKVFWEDRNEMQPHTVFDDRKFRGFSQFMPPQNEAETNAGRADIVLDDEEQEVVARLFNR